MDTPLAFELRKASAKFDDMAMENPQFMSEFKLAANIAVTLAHLIGGNGFKASFGPPGDWGYKTPIGGELRNVYDGKYKQEILSQEEDLKRLITLIDKIEAVDNLIAQQINGQEV